MEAYQLTNSGTLAEGWAEAFAYWSQVSPQSTSSLHQPYQAPLLFWFVVQVPKSGFSENVDVHETMPMWVAKSGKLLGVCKNLDEVDKLIEPRAEENIHLTYRVKIPNHAAFIDLLAVLYEKKFLEEEKA